MIARGLLGLLLTAVLPVLALAQRRVSGVVLRPSGRDAVPVPGSLVVLHRVGRATQGPIDSVTTGNDGRFAFRFEPDSTANYLLSTKYASIAYFSPPLAANRAEADTGIKLLVFDTSSTTRLTTKSRTLVMSRPDALGARTVVDWFVVSNAGTTTRVGRDSLAPTWRALLPTDVRNAQVGDARINQVSSDAVQFRGDTAFVFAPLSPGDKELLFQYELPPNATRVVVNSEDADSVDVFLEEPNASVGPGQWAVTSQTFEGRPFHRFSRRKLPGPLTVKFPGLGLSPATVLPALIAAFGIVLGLWSWRLVRSRRAHPVQVEAPPARTGETIAAEVAALDRRYRGRESDVPAGEWESYRVLRTQLMAELEANLARGVKGT